MTGYCPHCGRELSGLTVAARGYCEIHGWQWAEWTPRKTAAVSAENRNLSEEWSR